MTENKELVSVLKDIEKQFGKGSVMKLGEMPNVDIDSISTGSISIDTALGIGGLPRGRIVEIYGPEASGKSTLALQAARECQKNGGTVAYIDVENAIDPNYAKMIGVDIDNLLFSQPGSGEEALDIAETFIKSNVIDLIVVDSVAALVPQAELDGEMGDANIGLQARLMSKAMRKINGSLAKSNATIIFINQLREKVGVMFGNPETTSGGKSLKFYASVRIDIRKSEQIKEGTNVIGNKTNVKIVKNKVAPPYKTCVVENIYGEGFSKFGELVTLGSEHGIIDKSGAWYAYKGEKIGQGAQSAKKFLINNLEIAAEIEELLRAKLLTSKGK